MKYTFFHYILGITISCSLYACNSFVSRKGIIKPSDDIVNKQYTNYDINGITVASSGIILFYKQDNKSDIIISGPKNMVEALDVTKEINNGIIFEIKNALKFDLTDSSNFVKIVVSSPEITSIEAMNGGIVEIREPLNLHDNINIESFSNSKIYISNITARKVNIESFTNSSILIDTLTSENIEKESFTGSRIQINIKI